MNYALFVIEDEHCPESTIGDLLEAQGYAVHTARTRKLAIEIGCAQRFDLIIVDISGIDDLVICANLRLRHINTPILVLGPSGQTRNRIEAFKSGADDYLTKPIDPDDLQIRVEALLQRAGRRPAEDLLCEFGELRVNLSKGRLARNGFTINLSELEMRLLRFFVENRGQTISRATLLREVWGYGWAPLTRTVDVHILRLRQKIENDPKNPSLIITVPGMGYRFDG